MKHPFRKIWEWFLSLFWKRIDEIIQSRTDLLQIFDGFSDPVIVIDKQFVIQRVNRTTLTTLGKKSYKELIGKTCYSAIHGSKERCPSCTAAETFFSGEKTVRTGFLETSEKPLETVYNITCYPLTDERGVVTHVAEYYRSSTEIVNLTRELYESERARIMEPLAAGLAHQVRQPLTIIRASAQYGLGTFKKSLKSDDFNETMESIIHNVDTVNDVLADLLHFSKPAQYRMRKESIPELLEAGLKLMRQKIKDQKISVTKDWQKKLPEILMDKKVLLQAYLNLLMNSFEAMPQGGNLKISAAHRRDTNPPRIDIIIEDTGTGIPKELVPKLFHPFFTTKESGVGLGLSVAEGIVRSHGGRIRFEGREDRGTKVIIELPLSA
ncbi:MAG: PAS domain-containing protein [Deltaproteobacteria bacterium]|nr:PAS domain-containing protein [Deltaproteobacteria bacterium]